MTNEQQRIKIAEACGWRMVRSDYPDKSWIKPDAAYGGIGVSALPDYLNDLNAMHEAEKTLNDDQWLEYMLNLMDVCRRHTDLGKWTCVQVCMSATARQRAEAYLKTKGLLP